MAKMQKNVGRHKPHILHQSWKIKHLPYVNLRRHLFHPLKLLKPNVLNFRGSAKLTTSNESMRNNRSGNNTTTTTKELKCNFLFNRRTYTKLFSQMKLNFRAFKLYSHCDDHTPASNFIYEIISTWVHLHCVLFLFHSSYI